MVFLGFFINLAINWGPHIVDMSIVNRLDDPFIPRRPRPWLWSGRWIKGAPGWKILEIFYKNPTITERTWIYMLNIYIYIYTYTHMYTYIYIVFFGFKIVVLQDERFQWCIGLVNWCTPSCLKDECSTVASNDRVWIVAHLGGNPT